MISFVQAATNYAPSTNSATATFASNMTAGNFLVVAASVQAGTGLGITDGASDSFHTILSLFNPYSTDINASAIFAAYNINGGSKTVTISTTDTEYLRIIAVEFSGVATSNPSDGTSQGNGAGPSASSGSIITNDSDLVIGVFQTSFTNANWTAQSAPVYDAFSPSSPPTGFAGYAFTYTVQSSSGSIAMTNSEAGGAGWNYIAQAAAFKPFIVPADLVTNANANLIPSLVIK